MLLSKTPSTTCEHTWHYDSYCQWIEVAVHSEVKKISQGKYLQMNASNFVATISYSVFFTFFFSSVFHPQGVRKKNILIWCCIKFPEFSKNTLWWKPARAVTVSPGKREDFFCWLDMTNNAYVVGYKWCCGSLFDCQSQHMIWVATTCGSAGSPSASLQGGTPMQTWCPRSRTIVFCWSCAAFKVQEGSGSGSWNEIGIVLKQFLNQVVDWHKINLQPLC